MKIRTCFVSNSSSSSFICSTNGTLYAGMDLSPEDYEYCVCSKGHCFSYADAINTEQPSTRILYDDDSNYKEDYEYEDFSDYREKHYSYDSCPSIYCPCCQMETVALDDCLRYILKKLNLTDLTDVRKEILNTFNTYTDFEKYVKDTSEEYSVSKNFY